MNNFCYNAFLGLDISAAGKIKPCCKFLNEQIPVFDVKDGIKTYKESLFLSDLQKEFLENKKPVGCERCFREEDIGIKSKRQLDYEKYKDALDSISDLSSSDFKIVSIAFGNLCNFACRICNVNSSSKWVSEIYKSDGVKFPVHTWYSDNTLLDDIYRHTKSALHFDIPGGEPFLLEATEQFDFLDKFSDSDAKNISIHYTTNGSTFPKESYLKIWERFKEIDIQISIDDIEKRFEYNRWPGKWNEVYQNIKRFQLLEKEKSNIRLSVSFTVSAFTILYADEFYKWCLSEQLPDPWMGLLNRPFFYKPSIFKNKAKDYIRNKLNQSEFAEVRNLVNCLKEDDSQYFESFLSEIKKLDSIRNQSFKTTFDELSNLLDD